MKSTRVPASIASPHGLSKDLDQPVRHRAQNQTHPNAIPQSNQELSRFLVLALDERGVIFRLRSPLEPVFGESWHRLHGQSLGQRAEPQVNGR